MNSAERLYRGRISEMSYQDCGRVDGERGIGGLIFFTLNVIPVEMERL